MKEKNPKDIIYSQGFNIIYILDIRHILVITEHDMV